MKDYLELIQAAIATIALLGTTLESALRRLLGTRKSDEATRTRPAPKPRSDMLAITWLATGILSLLAAHSIFIAGRAPSSSPRALVAMTASVAVTLLAGYVAWRQRNAMRFVWSVALASLVIITLGPGGPFVAIDGDGIGRVQSGLDRVADHLSAKEPPVPYWATLPAHSLVVMLAAYADMAHYNIRGTRNARFAIIALIAFSIFVAASGGKALVRAAQKQPEAPPELSARAQQWIGVAIDELSAQELHDLYRKTSEVELAHAYRGRFLGALDELKRTYESDNKRGHDDPRQELGPHPLAFDASLNAKIRNDTRELIGRHLLLADEGKEELLLNRLPWRHPTSASGEVSDLPMSGLQPEDRLINLAPFIQDYAHAVLARNTLGSLRPRKRGRQAQGPEEGNDVAKSQATLLSLASVFPSPSAADPGLLTQLALPVTNESFVAFHLYQDRAVSIAGDHRAHLEAVFGLTALELRATFDFLAIDANRQRNLRVVYALAGCDEFKDKQFKETLKQITSDVPASAVAGLREIFRKTLTPDQSEIIGILSRSDERPSTEGPTEVAGPTQESAAPIEPTPNGVGVALSGESHDPQGDGELTRPSPEARAKDFTTKMTSCLKGLETETKALMLSTGRGTSVASLFSPNVIDFIGKIGSRAAEDEVATARIQQVIFALANPIPAALLKDPAALIPPQSLTDTSNLGEEPIKKTTEGLLRSYIWNFPSLERRKILHALSFRIYAGGGPFSTSSLGALIIRAKAENGDVIATAIAGSVMFPLILIALLLGRTGAKRIRERSAQLRRAERPNRETSTISGSPPASPSEFVGRDRELELLRSYARRGWNTVALVGPRGCGKSELLKALVEPRIAAADRAVPSESDSREGTIGVWVPAPTGVSEVDVINGMRERVAAALDSRISERVGAPPLAVRRLFQTAHRNIASVVVGASIVALVVGYLVINSVALQDASVVSAPLLLIAIFSAGAWVVYNVDRQDVDLRSLIGRHPNGSPELMALYTSVSDILAPSRARLINVAAGYWGIVACVVVVLAVVAHPIFGDTDFLFSPFVPADLSTPLYEVAALAIAGLLVVTIAIHYWFDAVAENKPPVATWASAVSDYREFVGQTVSQLRSGALGPAEWQIVVAVDELDRIVDQTKLAQSLIRLRSLFEIRGAFYYISVADDAYARLSGENRQAKNEIDSAIDHEVVLEGLSFSSCGALVVGYARHRNVELPEAMTRAIALASFGVARDAIRIVDRVVAEGARDLEGLLRVLEAAGGSASDDAGGGASLLVLRRVLRRKAVEFAQNHDDIQPRLREHLLVVGFETWRAYPSPATIREGAKALGITVPKESTWT
jgi:ABC-type multidrug transport system fused ATPase/permease subunit